jgi:hypothetical protein
MSGKSKCVEKSGKVERTAVSALTHSTFLALSVELALLPHRRSDEYGGVEPADEGSEGARAEEEDRIR